jgi:hypothetical protein
MIPQLGFSLLGEEDSENMVELEAKTGVCGTLPCGEHLPNRDHSLQPIRTLNCLLCILVVLTVFLYLSTAGKAQSSDTYEPVIEGDWWQVAGNPDLGQYTDPNQQPVDFAAWQAEDGSWQLWSCIRNTKAPGHTRLFYRWEGKSVTDTNWAPVGIAMMSDQKFGELQNGLQAPHVVKWNNEYYMAYGDWDHICRAKSQNGKDFQRMVGPGGSSAIFTEGSGSNSRDPMLLFTKGKWYCYYTARSAGHGYDFCRTSDNLTHWSDPVIVAYGGKAGNNPYSAECPHVVEFKPGCYLFFRTQVYSPGAQTGVYQSTNPMNFGIDDDSRFVCKMNVAAPEIINYGGRYYIAALNLNLDGIRIARLAFRKRAPLPQP